MPRLFLDCDGVLADFDAGALNFFKKLGQMGKTQRVKLEGPVFEKAFEVYSTDQVEARFILTPDFMERLIGLERTFKGRQVRCAFSGGCMYLCCEGKNLLEPGSMVQRDDIRSKVACSINVPIVETLAA